MRRIMSVAFIGLALAGATTVAAAQGRGRGHAGHAGQAGRDGLRGAPFDSARARRIDSLRTARGDSAWRRPDSDSARARGGRGGRGGIGGRALGGLNLTAAQKTEIKAINKKYADQFKQLRQANKNGVGQNPDARAQMQAIAERERAEIRGVLTTEQRTQFDARVAKHRGGKGKGEHGPTGGTGPQRRMQ